MAQMNGCIVLTDDEAMAAGIKEGLGPTADMMVAKNAGDFVSLLPRSDAKVVFVDDVSWSGQIGELCDAKSLPLVRITDGTSGDVPFRNRQLVMPHGCWNVLDFARLISQHARATFRGPTGDVEHVTSPDERTTTIAPTPGRRRRRRKSKGKISVQCPNEDCKKPVEVAFNQQVRKKCPHCKKKVLFDARGKKRNKDIN
jgi:hypothetical protein